MNNESRPNQKSPIRPMFYVVGLIVVIPLLLCGGFLTWFFGRQSAASRDVAVLIEKLRSDGKPIDDESLQRLYHSLTSDEATSEWHALSERANSKTFGEASISTVPVLGEVADVPPPNQPWAEQEQVTMFLAEWKELFDQVRSEAIKELESDRLPLRRPVEFKGFETLLVDQQVARTLARMMMLDFDVALYQGDRQRALQDIRAMRGIQRSFDGEPVVISQLIRIAVGTMANDMIRRGLEHDLFEEAQLNQLTDELPDLQTSHRMFQLAIQGERATGIPVLTDPEKAAALNGGQNSASPSFLSKMRSLDALFYLQMMDDIENLPCENLQQFHDAAIKLEADFTATMKNASSIEKMDRIVSSLILPAMQNIAQAFVREVEQANLARAAIGVRQFHFQNDRWPESLDELSELGIEGELVDTSGERPFGFQLEDDGVVLWGTDRKKMDTIPDQPHVITEKEDPQEPWVWRVRANPSTENKTP